LTEARDRPFVPPPYEPEGIGTTGGQKRAKSRA